MKRTTVLVIEDSSDHALLLRLAIEKGVEGADVRIAPSGAHARSYLAGEGPHSDRDAFPLPDVILVDMWLGDLTGLDILEWILRTSDLEPVPTIMLTSDPDPYIRESALALGAWRFLEKPQDFRELVQPVVEALAEGEARRRRSSGQPRRA